MGKHILLKPGDRFGRWTVKGYAGLRAACAGSRNRVRVYLCVCDCGREREVRGTDLTRGRTRSCGCLRWDVRKERAEERKPERRAPKPYIPEDIDQFTDDWMLGDGNHCGGSKGRRRR